MVNLVGTSMRSMKINVIRGLSGKFSTGSKKMADFRRQLRACLERENHKSKQSNENMIGVRKT